MLCTKVENVYAYFISCIINFHWNAWYHFTILLFAHILFIVIWLGVTLTKYVLGLTIDEGYSQLRICRPPTPQKWPYLHERCHCAETNEKLFFRLLFFELWLIVFTIYRWHTIITDHKRNSLKSGQIYMQDAKCAETKEKSIFRFLVFEI